MPDQLAKDGEDQFVLLCELFWCNFSFHLRKRMVSLDGLSYYQSRWLDLVAWMI